MTEVVHIDWFAPLTITRKFTRQASKRRCVLFAAGWREPAVVCYHIYYSESESDLLTH